VPSAGQDNCILNSIDSVHSSLTDVRVFSIPNPSFWWVRNGIMGMDTVKMKTLLVLGKENFMNIPFDFT
jgi:hypothetical protein